ncbi:MAG: TetR/AcrR family transcriptional regulator [Alphaproteobacteria bacterium]
MTQNTTISKRRFTPEVRRDMILDSTAKLVEKEGVSTLTMEQSAKGAGISKSLIYKYFDNIQDILKDLLKRELSGLRRAQIKAAEEAETFESLVRGITRTYLSYISKKGLLIEKLQADPSLSNSTDPTGYQRNAAVDYLAIIVNQNFGIPMETARAVTDISFGVPSSAGSYLLRHDIDMQELEDITVSMIIGTINGVRDDYMVRKQKLKR